MLRAIALSLGIASFTHAGVLITADRETKIAEIQKRISVPYKVLPSADRLSCAQVLALRKLFFLQSSFKHQGDELPFGRAKFIHGRGSVARVSLRFKRQPMYTGIFQEHHVEAFARISLAAPPKLAGYTPGLAIKIPISGFPSVDILAMPSIDGQGKDPNLFAHTYKTQIDEPTKLATKLLGNWFSFFVQEPNHLSLEHMASTTLGGTWNRYPSAPSALEFLPIYKTYGSQGPGDFRELLGQIPVETPLFEIYGGFGDDFSPIGYVFLESPFIASQYGDEELFFRHHSDHVEVPQIEYRPEG